MNTADNKLDPAEQADGLFLVTAFNLLILGNIVPLSARYLTLQNNLPIFDLLPRVLEDLLPVLSSELSELDIRDKLAVAEHKNAIYLAIFKRHQEAYNAITRTVNRWLHQQQAPNEVISKTLQHLQLDNVLAPLPGERSEATYHFTVKASKIIEALRCLKAAQDDCYGMEEELTIVTPGGAGTELLNPEDSQAFIGQIKSSSLNLAIDIS